MTGMQKMRLTTKDLFHLRLKKRKKLSCSQVLDNILASKSAQSQKHFVTLLLVKKRIKDLYRL